VRRTSTPDGGSGYTGGCLGNCQTEIDKVYEDCEACDTWEADKAEAKQIATELGCGGAAQVTPLFAALAAVANHFLN
jgi:hypothetical protein